MDLKTGRLFWPKISSKPPRCPSLQQDIRCDVAVIGAGLSGAMIAYKLNQAGVDVVLLEKRTVGEGSTSASTALVLYDIDISLNELIRKSGKAAAVRSYQCCLETIPALEKLVQQLGDKCQFQNRPSLYLASKRNDLPALKKEFETRKKHGFRVEFLTPSGLKQMFSFTAPGAIYSADAAEINPLQLAYRLARTSRDLGVRIFTRTEAAKVIEQQRNVVIHTTSGYKITARWLVKACGFETPEKVARRVVKLKSSYVMVTRPIKKFTGWQQRCLIWETRRPYFYARTTTDDRIMIGGEDEDFLDPIKRDRLIPQKTRQLAEKLRRLFPQIPIIPECWWAGTFGETKDGLPYIGRAQSQSRILYALCYGANGTNFAMIASDVIRDCVLRKFNPDAKLFGFER